MRPASILFGLTALAASCGAEETPISETQLNKMIKQMEEAGDKVDLEHPPYTVGTVHGEPTCIQNFFSCSKTVFFNRRTMVGGPYEVHVQPIFNEDATLVNDGDKEARIRSSESKARLESTTKGWQISATLSYATNGFTTGISGQYKDEWTKSTTDTKTVDYMARCPPHKTCRIQTVTFKAKLIGFCSDIPYLLCTGSPDFGPEHEMNVCTVDEGWVQSCSQYTEYVKKTEQLCKDRNDPQILCEVETILKEDGGKPFRAVVFTMDKD
ncbi:hypothetical protein CDD83_8613 [Cordyceps sp. RAO-2017]|nr:hypothetical protein CDD83_8613 [Cordyceps sp. RAO-2017]